jgi:cytochrome c peroxidase
MRFLNLLRRHFLDDFFLADRGVGIAADGRQHIPHIGPHKIGLRHSKADLIVPSNTGLRAGMALHGRAQIPFKGAGIILLNAKPHGIHDADQLLGVGIAGPRCRPQFRHRLVKAVRLHQIARMLNLGKSRNAAKTQSGNDQKSQNGGGTLYHVFLLLFSIMAGPVLASPFPEPLTDSDYHSFSPARAKIGQLLFYDKILSGNRNISCGTCHHHRFGGADGLSLGIGEGGVGVGPERHPGTGESRIKKRVPRNASALWNLGAKAFTVLFHDGRLAIADDFDNGFNTPAEEWLPHGLETVLGTQAIFPMTAQFEMAGNPKENEVAGALHDRIDAVWPILAKRVRVIPEYGEMFVETFDTVDRPEDVTISHIGEALAAFIALEFRSNDSPFDAFLAGDEMAMTARQRQGAALFYGKAGCADCHSGPLLTDQKFHALAIPPFGPGRTRRFDPYTRDVGRMGETDDLADAYRFRTPSLRNVTLTAPYGHNGAYPTLEGMIRHHLDPRGALDRWRREMANLPDAPWLEAIDFVVWQDRLEMDRFRRRIDITPRQLTDSEVAALVDFMDALTGESARSLPLGIPTRVPSGLPVDR